MHHLSADVSHIWHHDPALINHQLEVGPRHELPATTRFMRNGDLDYGERGRMGHPAR